MTLLASRTDLRNRLEESSSRFWSDAELTTWLNEACRAVARRAETIQSFDTSVAGVVGTQKYTLPSNVIRVHRVEFVPTGSTQQYPLLPSTDDELQNIVGVNPLQQSSYPSYFTIWGMPGGSGDAALKMKVYPVPAQTGTFQIYYYRQPATMTADGDIPEIPAGWDDLLVTYAESVALMKDRDPRWKDVRQMFENDLGYLIDVSRQYHDQERTMQMSGNPSTPAWLYSFEY